MAQTDFGRVLSRTEVQFKRASDALTQTRLFSEQSNLNAALLPLPLSPFPLLLPPPSSP